MSWKLKASPSTMRVTLEIAKRFADMEPAPHDRPLSERRLQVYQRLLARGEFRPVTWASAWCKETKGLYRVNGKHTSIMLAGLQDMPEFFVTVEEYECDELEDVARLYGTFDSKMQSRTANEIYLSFASTVPEFAGVQRRVLTVSVAGISLAVMKPEEHRSSQPQERAELLFDHCEFVLWLDELVRGGEQQAAFSTPQRSPHILRAPVAAAMVLTWKRDRKAAGEFWRLVRDETGASPKTPDRKLAKFLLTSGVGSASRAKRVANVGTREVQVKCLHAWNAWRAKEQTNLNYHPDKPIPDAR